LIYAYIGSVVLSVLAFYKHTEDNKYVYADLNTIFAPSSKQFLGTENKEVKVVARWHVNFCNPDEEHKKIQELAETGEKQKLIIGEKVIGNFVVTHITTDFVKRDAYGKSIFINCEIDLSEEKTKQLQTRKIRPKAPATTTDKSKADADARHWVGVRTWST